ncbi:MAG: hypothetical protein AAFO77_05285, partial [Pseudomonadota bacterium]
MDHRLDSLSLPIRRDPVQDVPAMILPAEEDSEDAHDLVRRVRREVEYSLVLCNMSKAVHDLRFQRSLEWNISKTRQI